MATKPTYPFFVSNTSPQNEDLIALYTFHEGTGSTIGNLIETADDVNGVSYDVPDMFTYDSLNNLSSSKWVTGSEGSAIKINVSSQNDDYLSFGLSKYIKSTLGNKGAIRIRFDNTNADTSSNQSLWSTNTPAFTTGSAFRLFRLSGANGKLRIISNWFSTTDSVSTFSLGLHDLIIMWDDSNNGTGFFKIIDIVSGVPTTLIDITTSDDVGLSTTNDSTQFSGMWFGAEYVSSAVNFETTNYILYLVSIYKETLETNTIEYLADNPYSIVQTDALIDPPKADYQQYPIWMKCNGSSVLPVLKNNSLTAGIIGSYLSSKGSTTTLTDLASNPSNAVLTNSDQWEIIDRGYQINTAESSRSISASGNKYITGNSSSFTIAFLSENANAVAADNVLFEKTNSSRNKGYGIILDGDGSWKGWIDDRSAHYCSLPRAPFFGYSLWILRYTYNSSGGSFLSFWRFDWSKNTYIKANDLAYTATAQTTSGILDLFIGCGKDGNAMSDDTNCGFLMYTMWNRALSDSELDEIGNDPFCIYTFPKQQEIKFHIAGHRLGYVDYDAAREHIYCSMYVPSEFNEETGKLIVSVHGTRSDNELKEMGISQLTPYSFNDAPHWGTIAEIYKFAVLCPRVFTSGTSMITNPLDANYGAGSSLQNNILDEDRILLVLDCVENNELTLNNIYGITGHSSGGSVDGMAARNPTKFDMVCVRHSTGFAEGTTLEECESQANFSLKNATNRVCWTADSTNGPFVKGTPYSTTNSHTGYYIIDATAYQWEVDENQKAIQRFVINARYDGDSLEDGSGFPVGGTATNSYEIRQDTMIEYCDQFGFKNIKQVVYSPPIQLDTPTKYDAPFVCERTDVSTYPHHCHAKDRDLAGAFFAFGFNYFFSDSSDIVLNLISDVGTKISFTISDPEAERTEWEFTIEGGEVFSIVTDGSVLTTPNVISSSINYIHIWLPPFHKFTVRVRQYVNTEWSNWTTSSEFISQGFLNSYDRYKLLTQQSTTVPDDGSGTSGLTYVDGELVDDGKGNYGTTYIDEDEVETWPQPDI